MRFSMSAMARLALCLVMGALVIAGCGSDNGNSSSNAPKSQNAAAQGTGSGQSAAVSASGALSPTTLCKPEGKAKLKKKCGNGLKKVAAGTVTSTAQACKGLSKKKTKGVKGKSPYAVCVSGAAKLLAANANAIDTSSADNSSSDSSSSDNTDNSTNDLVCTDSQGNVVSPDDPDLEDCEVSDNASASDSSNDGGGDSTDNSGDSTDNSGDSTDSSGDSTDSGDN